MTTDLTLKLFVAGSPAQHETLARRVTTLLDAMLKVPYRFDVIDVLDKPDLADLAHILVTPTLVIRFDSVERRLVGDLSNLTKLQLVITDSGDGAS